MENFLQLIFLIQIALSDLSSINPLIIFFFSILFFGGLFVLIVYLRYCYYRYQMRKKFYQEAESLLAQRGQPFTSDMKRGITHLLDKKEKESFTSSNQ